MSTIAVLPESSGSKRFRAVSGSRSSSGATVGQALDGLETDAPSETTLVIVQPMSGDRFFSQSQIDRLNDLMSLWRGARQAGTSFETSLQQELDALIAAELKASAARAASLLAARP